MPTPAPKQQAIFSDPDAITKGLKPYVFRMRITEGEKGLIDALCQATGKTEAQVGHVMFRYLAMVMSVSPICELLGCPAKMSVVARVDTSKTIPETHTHDA